MGDRYETVKVAAVQAASVFLDRTGSTDKACSLIREAGERRARHRLSRGFHSGAPGLVSSSRRHRRDRQSAVGRTVQECGGNSGARDGGPVRRGACRRRLRGGRRVRENPNTIGTLFNTQLYIGPDGTLIGKHQKIMPTVGERLVHTGGHGDTFGAFQTSFGPMSGLICGENSNPLAVFALTAEGTRIHVMSWPNHFPTSGDPMRNRVAVDFSRPSRR